MKNIDDPPLKQILVIALLLVFLVGNVVLAERIAVQPSQGENMSFQELFVDAPNVHYHLTPESLGTVISQVINCESGWTHHRDGKIIRGTSGEYGIAQFMPDTWDYFNELRGTNLDIMNREEQLSMIEWAFNNEYQNHWTCYRNL